MTSEQTSVAESILTNALRQPDGAAIETTDGVLTYRQFGTRVNEFAELLEKHTTPGEFVGIEAVRTAGSIIALVGALAANRPFVFVDSRDSANSNRAKVGSLGITWIAESSAGDDTPELVPTPDEWRPAADGRQPGALAELAAYRDEIGYAIHTSGSTGEPKCVLVRAEPLALMVRDHVRVLELDMNSRTLQFARLTFDGCLTEILWTLTAGACLVVLGEQHLGPGAVLQSTLEKFRITHLKTTPFALTATDPTGAMSLRHVVNGGGACRPAVVGKWSSVASFHNAYGTTETTVCNLLTGPLKPEDCADAVPLGSVVGDCGCDVLPLPGTASDAAGELVVTGESVAIGYLTAEGLRPFLDGESNRFYRTGDIVERRDGRFYYVERLDRQLKVRGYRLDPGEVESAACRLGGVVEAVVTAESYEGTDEAADDALVCYYLGDATPRELREHLEAVLDSYKVPSVLQRVEAMPYTRNGKVDRDALRASRRGAAEAAEAAAALTPSEQVLALVRQLTGVQDAGLEDNFFALGGNSASTVILVKKLKELGWMDAGVRDVLRAEHLRDLVSRLPERDV